MVHAGILLLLFKINQNRNTYPVIRHLPFHIHATNEFPRVTTPQQHRLHLKTSSQFCTIQSIFSMIKLLIQYLHLFLLYLKGKINKA